MKKPFLFLFAFFCFVEAQYPTYDGCVDLVDNDFSEVRLLGLEDDPTLDEPYKMDFYEDSEGDINIYFTERKGRVRYYDAELDKLSLVGEIDVFFSTESGLLGIALDPDFEKNRWIYLFYSPASPSVYRISRFTIKNDNTLDLSSEIVLIDLPDTRQGLIVHIGGDLIFDHEGNLWISAGEHDHCSQDAADYHQTNDIECSGEHTSTDSKSMYGGVLRIHPESDGSYTIPESNYGQYWSQKFKEEGRTVLAAKYADTSLVAPEVYAKGIRNTMSVVVDSVTGWAAVSECGGQCHKMSGNPYYCPPDKLSEKHMLMTHPGFHGWSYFSGKDNYPYAFDASDRRDPLKPVNNSPFRQGVDTLPPAIPGTYVYGLPEKLLVNNWICAVGGFVYRYNWENPSEVQLPPHFDGRFIISDMNQSFIRAIELDSNGQNIGVSGDLFESIMTKSHTMDLRQGPDGSMYLLNYAEFQYEVDMTTGIYKIEYHGDCNPVKVRDPGPNAHGQVMDIYGFINLEGDYTADFFGIDGKKVYTFRGTGRQRIPSGRLAGPGVYQVKVTYDGKVYRNLFTNL